MSLDDALSILVQAAQLAPLPRAGHVQVQQAEEALRTHLHDQAAKEAIAKAPTDAAGSKA